jgi:hypothetical protein
MDRPSKNDEERPLWPIEGPAEPDDDDDAIEDDAIDERMHRELARRGLTLESWAAQWRGRAQEVLDQHRRARRARALKIGAAAAVGFSAAAAVTVAVVTAGRLRGGPVPPVDVQQSHAPMATPPDATQPDAGRGAPRRR